MVERIVLVLMLCMTTAGCWGEIKDIFPDGGVDAGTSLPNPALVEGGGTKGPIIDGRVSVYVRSESDGLAVMEAQVLVRGEGVVLSGETDAEGLAVLDDPSLTGPVDVHVLAAGKALESMYGLEVSSATLTVVSQLGSASSAVTLSGTVSGLDGLPVPGGDQYRSLAVMWGPPMDEIATMKEMGLSVEDLPRVVIDQPTGDEADFQLQVPAGSGCLFVNAGIVSTFGTTDPSDDVFKGSSLGFSTGLQVQGEEVSDIALSLDTPLSVTVSMTTSQNNLPEAYDLEGPRFALDFGEEGTVWFERRFVGSSYVFEAPLYTAPFDETEILLVSVGAAEPEAGDETLGSDHPIGYTIDRGLEDYNGFSAAALPLLGVPAPPIILGWDGSGISSLPPPDATLGRAMLSGPDGAVFWRATSLGSLPMSLNVPDLPEDWVFEELPTSGVYIQLLSASLGAADMHRFSFDSYPDLLETVAVDGVFYE